MLLPYVMGIMYMYRLRAAHGGARLVRRFNLGPPLSAERCRGTVAVAFDFSAVTSSWTCKENMCSNVRLSRQFAEILRTHIQDVQVKHSTNVDVSRAAHLRQTRTRMVRDGPESSEHLLQRGSGIQPLRYDNHQ